MALRDRLKAGAGIVGIFALLAGLGLAVGCNNSTTGMGPSSGGGGGGGGLVTVTASGTSYSPNALTVTSGTQVQFNYAGHTVHIDDGTGSGTCGAIDLTGTANPVTFVGPSGTVFHIHCDFHSACGAASCVSCTGMTMMVFIQ